MPLDFAQAGKVSGSITAMATKLELKLSPEPHIYPFPDLKQLQSTATVRRVRISNLL